MAVNLIGWTPMNHVVSKLGPVRRKVRQEARIIATRAQSALASANATTRITPEGYFPAFVDTSFGDVDAFVNLTAPNAMALEFGHDPSGVFGPGGRFAHIKTKAPDGLYILTHATGLTDLSGPG